VGSFGELGVSVEALRAGRRPLTRVCVDWSERRPHIAGALGAALATRLFERRWIQRRPGVRAVAVTDMGCSGLAEWLGVVPDGAGGWR
jgi:hypothetical protein